MASIIIWIVGVGASIAALVIAAAFKLHYVHMAVAAAVAILIALAAIAATRSVELANGKRALLTSSNIRHLGLVWAWAALALFVTYAFVLQWREWWHFVLAFAALAAACLALSIALAKDAESDHADDTMLKLARIVAIVHLVAMVITVVGLIIDGKMVRFLNPRHQDWAAQNIFFFGAIALAAISWHTLATIKHADGMDNPRSPV
jgi:hypothetical protein